VHISRVLDRNAHLIADGEAPLLRRVEREAPVWKSTSESGARAEHLIATRVRHAIENCEPPGTSPSKQISERQKFFRSSGTDISFPSGGSSLTTYGNTSIGSCGFGSFTLWTAPGSQPKPPPSEQTTRSDL